MFRRATELSPDNEAAFYGLALVLQESEDPGARVMWESFLRRFPDGSLALRAKEFLAK
jgi:cytochrome c-type biogenesis protein CcmH/NrfG